MKEKYIMEKNIYLLLGEEKFDREDYFYNMKEAFGKLEKGINFIILDKENINHLENEIMTYPFGYSKKLIVVRLPEKKIDGANQDENKKSSKDWITPSLEELLNSNLDNIYIIFIGTNLEKSSKIRKIVEKNGEIIIFEKLKSNELISWIIDTCNRRNIVIEKSDALYFVESCGDNKEILYNELIKIIDYTGDNNKITKEIIDKLCIKTPEVIIFTLTDFMGNRNVKGALSTLEDLIENKEPLQKIIVMIEKHFKSVLLAKVALKEKRDVARELNIKSYPALKYSSQSKNYTIEELISICIQLAKLDIDSKTGKMDLKIGLEKIICNV